MNKNIIFVLMFVLVIFIAGCSPTENNLNGQQQPTINNSANDDDSPDLLTSNDVNEGLGDTEIDNLNDVFLDSDSLG